MRLREIIFYAVWLIILVILQPTLMQWIGIFGISPNAYLVFVVAAAFTCGKSTAVWVGAIFGLIYDFTVGRAIGISGLMFMYIGLATGFAEERFLSNSGASATAVVTFIMSFVYGIVYYIAYATVWGDMGFWYALGRVILPECLYTAVLGFVIINPIRKSFTLAAGWNKY